MGRTALLSRPTHQTMRDDATSPLPRNHASLPVVPHDLASRRRQRIIPRLRRELFLEEADTPVAQGDINPAARMNTLRQRRVALSLRRLRLELGDARIRKD